MSFDKETRNLLAKTVTNCRRRLTEDITNQLTGVFGLHSDGTVLSLNDMKHLSPDQVSAGERLRDLLEHYTAGAPGREKARKKSAYQRMTLEISFTILNRLAVLRLCEERDLVIECVRKGTASDGFRLFESVSGGALGSRYDAYRVFLECMFDELAVDLGMLFDRTLPQSSIFPSELCMEDVLEELNKPELTHLWTEDETIGWIYQYFNPPEERKAMRDASAAPRNSRELAVRNQFFTPRYVVEFLTDNTLGRIWYEMRKGDTTLKDECRYLVRRPNEVFLAEGEEAPAENKEVSELSQEELLKHPEYIEHRPKKDPRDIRILDPACGSGHFLLYAFDLLETIYKEAWEDEDCPKSEVTSTRIRDDYKNLEELRREIPKLVMEYNLHGIDIDPRAVQIAASALWLRAQKSWKSLGMKAAERPRILKSNIVTAEPMPGEEDMKQEFIEGLRPRILGQLVDTVFEKMKLAGEAGALLKIEEEIKEIVVKAKAEYQKEMALRREDEGYLPGFAPERETTLFDFRDMSDEDFLDQAEETILQALKKYAESAESGKNIRRRLFADDAGRGFAFIDLCRKRYDVVLMNPPFGLPTKSIRGYIWKSYPDTYVDMYACCVTRGRSFAHSGFVGAITSRAFLTMKKLARWRANEVVKHVQVLLDLGLGIMDDAFVEASAYVLSSSIDTQFIVFNKRNIDNKNIKSEELDINAYVVNRNNIMALPFANLLYAVPPQIHSLLRSKNVFEPEIGTVREGLRTFDDFRFLRLKWEVDYNCISSADIWEPLAKGGEYARYYSDLPLLIRWCRDGKELSEENRKVNGQIAQSRQASDYYRRSGCTYSKRSAKGFSSRVLPKGCIIGTKGPAVLSESEIKPQYIIGWLNSRLMRSLIHIQANAYEFNTGILKRLPWKMHRESNVLESLVMNAVEVLRDIASYNEVNAYYTGLYSYGISFKEYAHDMTKLINEIDITVDKCQKTWDLEMDKLYRVDSMLLDDANNVSEINKGSSIEMDMDNYNIKAYDTLHVTEDCISYALGTIFGRWDLRIMHGPSQSTNLPDPFDLLPVCPPGMLISPNGMPAKSQNIVSKDWLRARPDANTLPPEGSVKNPTIPDSEYPIRISWDGILVEDPRVADAQPHKDDLVRRIREVLNLLWKEKDHEIEQEACDILGVSELRDYFRKPTKFFKDHLKRYSKSRRKAPIYWPLSTASGSYTIWIYYHRLNDQMLYTAVNKYVDPKISEVEGDISRLEVSLNTASGREATTLRDKLTDSKVFLGELRDYREELLRIAALPYKPNLNDGVIINAAPFHMLFGYKPWAKETEKVWKKLEAGEYDWAHLAYTIWPERVREVCIKDRSIAIAHDLEDICEVEYPDKKKGRSTKKGEGQ